MILTEKQAQRITCHRTVGKKNTRKCLGAECGAWDWLIWTMETCPTCQADLQNVQLNVKTALGECTANRYRKYRFMKESEAKLIICHRTIGTNKENYCKGYNCMGWEPLGLKLQNCPVCKADLKPFNIDDSDHLGSCVSRSG